ncbi:hypothetical protein T265_03371 [Opisthorchis viverrini]|uniref:Uncharacterized protein n=1 Tax=Opisthorchis viverrini TaxID=6198 RepID=A0A075AHL7_OPIVI|nr:hypothetical protein T265_03371 [Opisthorchis viverrini]KER30104.1 hypothetical protein T265_03371 [Opisthorchis viverrini]
MKEYTSYVSQPIPKTSNTVRSCKPLRVVTRLEAILAAKSMEDWRPHSTSYTYGCNICTSSGADSPRYLYIGILSPTHRKSTSSQCSYSEASKITCFHRSHTGLA